VNALAVVTQVGKRQQRTSFGRIKEVQAIPNLLDIQRRPYEWFLAEGLTETFHDISPIESFTGNLVLEFIRHVLDDPEYSVEECKDRDMTYTAPMRVRARLVNKKTGEVKEQEVFLGDFPLMTEEVGKIHFANQKAYGWHDNVIYKR
jgi:DNA-directed RNA polymerase subunit beta